jgi:hypothetical protein
MVLSFAELVFIALVMHCFKASKIEGAQAPLLSGKFRAEMLLQRIFGSESPMKTQGGRWPAEHD